MPAIIFCWAANACLYAAISCFESPWMIEMVWMSYEVEDYLELLAPKPEERHLSG